MNYKRNLKGVSIPRVIVPGILIFMIVAWATFYFAGGFLSYGHFAQNATLATQYNAIQTNSIGGNNILAGYQSINKQQTGQLNNYTSPNFVTTILSTINVAGALLGSVVSIYDNVITFIAAPFAFLLGISIGYVIAIIDLLVIVTIAIAIITIWSLVY